MFNTKCNFIFDEDINHQLTFSEFTIVLSIVDDALSGRVASFTGTDVITNCLRSRKGSTIVFIKALASLLTTMNKHELKLFMPTIFKELLYDVEHILEIRALNPNAIYFTLDYKKAAMIVHQIKEKDNLSSYRCRGIEMNLAVDSSKDNKVDADESQSFLSNKHIKSSKVSIQSQFLSVKDIDNQLTLLSKKLKNYSNPPRSLYDEMDDLLDAYSIAIKKFNENKHVI